MSSEKTRMVVLDDLEQGKPLRYDGDTVYLPEVLLDVHQSCIRFFGSLPALGIRDRDILLADSRTKGVTGMTVIAKLGENVYVGHWWAKHGKLRLMFDEENSIEDPNLRVFAAVSLIVRPQ